MISILLAAGQGSRMRESIQPEYPKDKPFPKTLLVKKEEGVEIANNSNEYRNTPLYTQIAAQMYLGANKVLILCPADDEVAGDFARFVEFVRIEFPNLNVELRMDPLSEVETSMRLPQLHEALGIPEEQSTYYVYADTIPMLIDKEIRPNLEEYPQPVQFNYYDLESIQRASRDKSLIETGTYDHFLGGIYFPAGMKPGAINTANLEVDLAIAALNLTAAEDLSLFQIESKAYREYPNPNYTNFPFDQERNSPKISSDWRAQKPGLEVAP
jgi:hypothetical protein